MYKAIRYTYKSFYQKKDNADNSFSIKQPDWPELTVTQHNELQKPFSEKEIEQAL